jgi:putative DNA primase/helicase
MTLTSHTPDVYSTVQLNVSYNPDAECSRWLQFLDEVFEGSRDKVEALQEFFGLCLTRDTKQEKALVCIGEGANGKSVTMYVLEKMLGEENYSSVSLERFDNHHYLADLFGKLANITIETNAKTVIYDSTFKAIVSGDTIHADAKYKKPVKFKPFCKIVVALNNMPRVDDKSDGFFRRLIILRFTRQFKEEEQDKNLKFKLEQELDGIFLWSLEGLRRLNERGHFNERDAIHNEVEEYRRQNNNVMVFITEMCDIDSSLKIPKDDLYKNYSEWCKSNGCYPLSKINFGKEILKHYHSIAGGRDATTRYWIGIGEKNKDDYYDTNDNDGIPF